MPTRQYIVQISLLKDSKTTFKTTETNKSEFWNCNAKSAKDAIQQFIDFKKIEAKYLKYIHYCKVTIPSSKETLIFYRQLDNGYKCAEAGDENVGELASLDPKTGKQQFKSIS